MINHFPNFRLPGDYIAMKLSGTLSTTVPGLSEGIFWDFSKHAISDQLLGHYGLSASHIPEITDTFGLQGQVHKAAAEATGLAAGTPITYRAGDQPNNALSLGVTKAGQVAATGGTSGVIYGITDQLIYDPDSRINTFAHVNHQRENPSLGLLLCINGAGIQYAWMKHQMASAATTYADMEQMAGAVPIGADGLRILPFGNGAERMLLNTPTGAQINNLQFNRHHKGHLYRAALEGIAFSFVYGFQVMKTLGLAPQSIKVGNDNLFRSRVFSTTIAHLLECSIEVLNTTGAIGAAQASGIGAGIFQDMEAALAHTSAQQIYYPDAPSAAYQDAYRDWYKNLKRLIQ
jgi:xylulokinase